MLYHIKEVDLSYSARVCIQTSSRRVSYQEVRRNNYTVEKSHTFPYKGSWYSEIPHPHGTSAITLLTHASFTRFSFTECCIFQVVYFMLFFFKEKSIFAFDHLLTMVFIIAICLLWCKIVQTFFMLLFFLFTLDTFFEREIPTKDLIFCLAFFENLTIALNRSPSDFVGHRILTMS